VIRSLRLAGRRLAQARGFALAAILALGLGLGGTTAIFSVVNAVLIRPLPFPAPDRLVSLSHSLVVGRVIAVDQTDASLLFYRRHHRAFLHLGGYQITAAALASGRGMDAERLPAGRVTSDVFPALGVSPLLGRTFADADDRPGAAPVALIGERLWARKYARDPGLLNSRVQIDGVAHEVVGIMPERAQFPHSDTQLWLPLRLDPAATDSATFDYQAVGRLRDGVSMGAAAADLQRLLPLLPDAFPGRLTRAAIEQTQMRASVRPLAEVMIGDIGRVLWPVLAAAGLVLAIACANVGNLFLVRAEGRRQAIAVQRALGAARRVMFLEFLSEGLIVAAAGGALGVAMAAAAVQALRSLGSAIDIPRLGEVGIDATVLGAAGILSVGAALFVSGVPALRSAGGSMASVLAAANRSATAGRERHRARNALVISQVALALVVLVSSGLMARTVWRLRSVQPGFDAASALTFRLALPPATYPGSDDSVRFFARAVDEIAAVPGVRAAGAASKLPLDDQGRTDTAVFVEDRPLPPGSLPGIHPVVYVTPGYLGAAGIPLIAGRSFTRPDPPRVLLEVIVSRALADRYWRDQPAVGRRIRILSNGPWYTVVGVAGNVRDTALDRREDEMIYCPLLPARDDPRWEPRDLAFVVRTAGDPGGATAAIREVLGRLDPSLPMYRVRPLADLLAHASARRSFTFVLMACAAGVALLLGAIGVYGVMAYAVTLRSREIGIRLALGAQPAEVRLMVARSGLAVAAMAIALGLAGALGVTRFLTGLLVEVSPTDPAVFLLSAVFLLLVAAAAGWVPARRAARVHPAHALRAD